MTEKAHWMRPLSGRISDRVHLLLWVEEKYYKGRATAKYRDMWRVVAGERVSSLQLVGSWADAGQLDTLLLSQLPKRGPTMVWMARGWEDMVLTGIAELIDSGTYAHKYISIDGGKVLARGTYHGRGLTVTSLGNWYGGGYRSACHYDDGDMLRAAAAAAAESAQARGEEVSRAERVALMAWYNILSVGPQLIQTDVAATIGAAAIKMWRSWLGPRVSVVEEAAKNGPGKPKRGKVEYVAPLPNRPAGARNAERHASYPMDTSQLASGRVDGPLYLADISNAYLLSLATSPLPVQYQRTLTDISLTQLAETNIGNTALALVLIDSPDTPYPARRSSRVQQTVGRFWTWLCGTELASALCAGHVSAVHTAHIWSSVCMSDEYASNLVRSSARLSAYDNGTAKCIWRGLYSALVGRFAARRRVWRDIPTQHSFGRWSTWQQADPDTGEIVPHRSIAGQSQRLIDVTDTSDSVALLYACVTGKVRHLLRQLLGMVGEHGAVLLQGDAAILTHAGYQAVIKLGREQGIPPDGVAIKQRIDRAWLSGGSVAVLEYDGRQHILSPGVPSEAVSDESGSVSWPIVDAWHTIGQPHARRGVGVRLQSMRADKIISAYDYPLRWQPNGVKLDDVGIPMALLEPLPNRRKVDDV